MGEFTFDNISVGAAFDKDLFDLISDVVAQPKKKQPEFWQNSFILHAPLELCARYYLLPLVDGEHREEARERIREVGKKYVQFENDDTQTSRSKMRNIDKWAQSFAFAGHATILLALTEILGETNDYIVDVLDRMDAEIENGDAAHMLDITSENTEIIDRNAITSFFIDRIGNIEKVKSDTATIAQTIQDPERAGVIAPVIGSLRTFEYSADDIKDRLFPVLIRIAVLSMLIEDEVESKYGWTHCLTIPHSHWVLSKSHGFEKQLFESAATYISAFRSTMGKAAMSSEMFAQYFDEDEESIFTTHHEDILRIISEASTYEDAHLVKYVYSCFDCMKRDPQYSSMYIAGAQRLLDIWKAEAVA
jgi:hypothetical protein